MSKNTYLGFSIRYNSDGERTLYVVDDIDNDRRIYGGYFGASNVGEFDDDLYGAVIMEVNLFDGTMPLDASTFNEMATSDEFSEGSLFWEGRPIAVAHIMDTDGNKALMKEVYDNDPHWLFDFMLEQCNKVRKVVNNDLVEKNVDEAEAKESSDS